MYAAGVTTVNGPVKPIDEASGPRHDSYRSNASTAVDNGDSHGPQNENHRQEMQTSSSYFPQSPNVPQVVVHPPPAGGPPVVEERTGYLEQAMSRIKRVKNTMRPKQPQNVSNQNTGVGEASGSSLHAPATMSDTSLVQTPLQFYGLPQEPVNLPGQLEQRVSPPTENARQDQNSETPEDQSPTQLGTPQSPMQLGRLEVTLKQIQSENRFSKLWYKIHVLVYDLQVSRNRPDNQQHLNRVLTLQERRFPLGAPYFDDLEVAMLLSLPLRQSIFVRERIILWNLLRLRYNLGCSVRANQGGRNSPPDVTFKSREFFVESSEDLGSYLQNVLRVKEKNLHRKTFLGTMAAFGLDIDNERRWL
jgi:hypothetical protein